jgi:hypothetical protein
MTTDATVRTYCNMYGRGTAVAADGTVHEIACYTFDRKGPGTPTLDEVCKGTRIVFDKHGPATVWRTVN